MDDDEHLLRDAATIEHHLRYLRKAMLRAFEADKRQSQLTMPQVHVMEALTSVPSPPGMTLTALSEQLDLAQSTVSGIVERLERRGFVRRYQDPADRRFTRVEVTEPIQEYLQRDRFARRLSPLVTALQGASEADRQTIVAGLATLQRLFERVSAIEHQ
jgi:MarR family transcriptional regulator, organic hydroperoxide resistance regulator